MKVPSYTMGQRLKSIRLIMDQQPISNIGWRTTWLKRTLVICTGHLHLLLACKNRRIPSCSHMHLTERFSRMRFQTDMLLNNKTNKTKSNNKVCLNNVMDTICNFPRYSVDKEGMGDKGKKRQRKKISTFFKLFSPLWQNHRRGGGNLNKEGWHHWVFECLG